jgi:hypothetical protein
MNKNIAKFIFLGLALPLFFLSFSKLAQAEATCHRPYCYGGSICEGGWVSDGNAIGCQYTGELVCVPETDNRQECGSYEEFIYPVYGYPAPAYETPPYGTPPYGTPPPTCGGQGQACCESQPYCTTAGTVCCRPGSNVCEYACGGGYSSEYPSPYGSEYGSEYATPAYGTPAYSYQAEYGYQSPAASFDYSLSNSGSVNVTKSGSNVFADKAITKTLVAGTSQSVTLSLSGVPANVSYSLANGTCNPTCITTITFTVAPSAPVGTHSITVTGAPLNKTTQFNLVISAAPASALEVTCTPSDEEIVIGEIVTWTGEVTGGTEPYTYSWNGPGIPTSPAPSTNPFSIRYSTVGVKTATLTVTDSTSAQGFCTFDTGSGSADVRVNFNPLFEEF